MQLEHEIGDCADAAFKNSGGHINPMGMQHGLENEDGPDNADLPNLVVAADGTSDQTVLNDRLSFYGQGDRPALFDFLNIEYPHRRRLRFHI